VSILDSIRGWFVRAPRGEQLQIREAIDVAISRSRQPPKRDMIALLAAYSTMPRLRAIVDLIGNRVASAPWEAYRVQKKTTREVSDLLRRAVYDQPHTAHRGIRRNMIRALHDDGVLKKIEGHPALDVLARGAPGWFNGHDVRKMMAVHRELVGEWFAVKQRFKVEGDGRGVPAELWPFSPSDVMELPSTANGMVFKLRLEGGAMKDVPARDAIWARDADPAHPYGRGVGIAKTLANELDADEYAAQTTSALFYNRGVPDTVMVLPKAAPNEIARVKELLREEHGGHLKARIPFVTGAEGIDVKQISQSFADMDLVNLRNAEGNIIRQTWGIPPESLGDVTNSNRATITMADIMLARLVLVPRLESWQDAINTHIVPEFPDSRDVFVTYESPVPSDQDLEKEYSALATWALSFDEMRERQGAPAIGGDVGRKHLIPIGFQLVDPREPTTRPVPAPAASPPPAAPQPPRPEAQPSERPTASAEAPAKVEQPAAGAKPEEGKAFARTKALDPRIKAVIDAIDPDQMTDILGPTVRAGILEFLRREIESAGGSLDLDIVGPLVDRYLKLFGSERITGLVNDTTREAIRTTLAEGLAEGETRLELLTRVRDVFKDANEVRAESIARTETLRASNWAITQGQAIAGVRKRKWVAILDTHVRPAHALLNGTIVGIEEPFEYFGKKAMHPGGFGEPELDINCRCTTVSVLGADGEDEQRAMTAAITESDEIAAKAFDARLRPFEDDTTAKAREAFRAQERAVLAAMAEQFGRRSVAARRRRRAA
jgi:SPP1 gp7 family putative phage head morphogenesis protein